MSFDRRPEIPDLEGTGGEPIPVRGAEIRGALTRSNRGVDLTGQVRARVQLLCSRCTEPFEIALAPEFFLTLVSEPVEIAPGERQMDEEDVSLFHAPEGKVDLIGLIAEQIYLNLPLKPICTESCKGLCPNCGTNRNQEICECLEESIDPRLAPLLDFKKGLGES